MQDRPVIRRPQDLAAFIDHTILKPDAREADIARFCEEAMAHRFRSVCVNGVHAAMVARMLAGSDSVGCVVVGFPLGASVSAIMAAEAAAAVEAGAAEVDMVIAIGALKDGNRHAVRDDIAAVRRACGPALLKVIIETCLLTDAEKVTACHLAHEAGADFVKTSTGFAAAGATIADVALMRRTLDAAGATAMGVKASGGIRNAAVARAMIEAGASRIGTSSGVAIVADTEAATGS